MIDYDDLPDGTFNDGSVYYNARVTPLDVQLKPSPGLTHVWKAVLTFKDGINEITDEMLLGKGYSPVAPSVYPKLPEFDGRIEWKGLVLCVAPIEKTVEEIMEENEEAIVDFAFKKIEVWNQIDEVVDAKIREILWERERETYRKSRFYKLKRFIQRMKAVINEDVE